MGNCPDCPFTGSVTHTNAELARSIGRYRGVTHGRDARIRRISFSQGVVFRNPGILSGESGAATLKKLLLLPICPDPN